MKIVIGILMLATVAFGQQEKPQPPIFAFANSDALSWSPHNAHEMALEEFRRYRDYQENKPKSYGSLYPNIDHEFVISYTASFKDQPSQSFTIEMDGTITLNNITAEDALLLLASDMSRNNLTSMKEFDRQQAQRDEERKVNPPTKLRAGKKNFKVSSVPLLDNGVLGNTNCSTQHINILMSDGAKRVGVLHEMMHVATGCDGSSSLHRAIYRLQVPLLKLLQDNPDMVDYLLKRGFDPSGSIVCGCGDSLDHTCIKSGISTGWDEGCETNRRTLSTEEKRLVEKYEANQDYDPSYEDIPRDAAKKH